MIPSIVATLHDTPSAIRHSVRPGLAGLWQISEAGASQIKRDCKLDVAYVRRRSLWLDLVILHHTVRGALGRPKLSEEEALSLAVTYGRSTALDVDII